jgi:purine nucleosidase
LSGEGAGARVKQMRNFLIDTDTASDDAVAIMMALADLSVRVLGLTTVAGNVGLEQATRNALLTAEICNAEVPVFRGAAKPLTRAHEHAHWFHGKDGLGDHGYPAPKRAPEREHAVEAIVRLAHAEPGLTLVTLGPLTNIALALARDPTIADRIGRCVIMGGAPCCEGNVTPAAEYNIWVDPEAARAVFRSSLPIEMVGWHVSRGDSVLSDEEIAEIEALGTPKAKFAIETNSQAREAYRIQTGEVGLSLADPTAMAIALDRSVGLTWSRHRVAIETQSELTRGMTVVDRLNVNADDNNVHVWNAASGEHEGADIVWTFDSARFRAILKAALAS